jgi:AraC-like DNA-binding protein
VDVYREYAPPPELAAHIACLWVSHDREVHVLPDACADIVFEDGRLVVAGPATAVQIAAATPGRRRCGIRFRTGSAGVALRVPADAVRDLGPELTEVWGREARRLQDRVAAAPTIEAAAAVLLRGVAGRLPGPGDGDPLIRALVRGDIGAGEDKGVRPLYVRARELGLSERQLRRRFEAAVGYGPATLLRVRRFQAFLAAAQTSSPGTTLARLAADAGYADQAHLAREARRLSGRTPSELLAHGAAPTGETLQFRDGDSPCNGSAQPLQFRSGDRPCNGSAEASGSFKTAGAAGGMLAA